MRRFSPGFSLIEVGIVFAVVAVVVGGIMAGKHLYEGAQVNAVERNIKEYTQAADKFKEMYGALPGDFSGASSYFSCSSCDGNGNGAIEAAADVSGVTVDETKLFWQHLRYAKLVGGKTETISSTVYPAGPFDGTVYRVSQDETRGVVYELTGYSGTTFGYSAMKPGYVKKLDEKYDDGKPDTGSIRASNGSGVATCISGSSYTASTDSAACVINLSIQKEGVLANDDSTHDLTQSITGCDTTNIGETRPSTTTCPTGYVGNIIESCGRTGWRVTSRSCAPISCGGGFYNDTRVLSCPPGYTGSRKQYCNAGGGWLDCTGADLPVTGCVTPSCVVGGSCTTGDTMTSQCPFGYTGKKVLRCSGGTWAEDNSSSCTQITCTSGATTKNVGDYFSDSTACPSGFTGAVTKTCTSDGNFVVTSNNCVPTQNVSCTAPATRTLTCPTGTRGNVSQECRTASGGGTIWVTTEYTCSPIMCGDKPAGYIRQSSVPCASGQTGYKEEVCQTTGQWLMTSNTCAARVCAGEAASSTYNATFADTNAGSSATGTCNTGYTSSPSAPILACNTDGTWATSLTSGGCVVSSTSYVAATWGASSGGQIYTSSDAITWTRQTSPFGSSYIYEVAYNGLDTWVAVGQAGTLATSTNGITWTSRTSGFGASDIMGVAHNGQSGANGRWVIVGAGNKTAYSNDAITWTLVSGAHSGSDIYSVAHNGLSGTLGKFMYVTTDQALHGISSDGTSWTARNALAGNYASWGRITNNHDTTTNKWVFGRTGPSIIHTSSDDGVSWTSSADTNVSQYGMAYDGVSRWVGGGNCSYCKTSTNLTAWSDGDCKNLTTSGRSGQTCDVAYWSIIHNHLPPGSGGLWIAGGTGCTTYPSGSCVATMLTTSTDGVVWTERTFPAIDVNDATLTFNEGINALASSKAQPCAAATLALDSGGVNTGTFAQTADSTTYTASCPAGYAGAAVRKCTNGAWGSLVSECQTAPYYVAVTSGGSSGGKIYTSVDGTTWTAQTSPFGTTGINAVAYNGIDMWVAVGDSGKLATSPDGVIWTLRTSSFGTTHINSVAHNGQSGANSRWVIVGKSNKTAYSTDGITWTQVAGGHAGKSLFFVEHNGLSGSLGYFMYKQEQDGGIAISTNGAAWTSKTGVGWALYEKLTNNKDTTTNTWVTTASSVVKKSTDNGASWTTVYTGAISVLGLGYDGVSRWVGGSNCSQGGTSTNLTVWATSDLKGTSAYNCTAGATGDTTKVIIHNKLTPGSGGLWLSGGAGCNAFPSGGCTTTKLTTSTDGISWTRRSFPAVDQAGEQITGIGSSKAASCAAATLALNAGGSATGTFPQTADSTTYTYTCSGAYSGTAVRRCSNGTWGALLTACTP